MEVKNLDNKKAELGTARFCVKCVVVELRYESTVSDEQTEEEQSKGEHTPDVNQYILRGGDVLSFPKESNKYVRDYIPEYCPDDEHGNRSDNNGFHTFPR